MGSEVYFWKTLPIWRHYVPIAKLCFQFETNNAFTKVSNSEVKFTNNARWIFQNADHDFSYRIYHLRMTVDGTVGGNYVAANLGVCVQKNLPMCTTRRMGYFDCGLTHHASIFRIGRIPGCVYCTFDRQYCAHSIKTETRTYEIRPIFCAAYNKKMPKFVFGMSIGIELDLLERTIHFFYNGVLVPYVVRNVPASVAIGFCGSPTNNVTMKGVSLEKRTKPTVDPSVPCIPVPYSDKDVL